MLLSSANEIAEYTARCIAIYEDFFVYKLVSKIIAITNYKGPDLNLFQTT